MSPLNCTEFVSKMKVKVFFVMGTDSSGKEDLWIRREAKEFCDVIQVRLSKLFIALLWQLREWFHRSV